MTTRPPNALRIAVVYDSPRGIVRGLARAVAEGAGVGRRRGSAAPRRGAEPGAAHLREAVRAGTAPEIKHEPLVRGSRTPSGPTASPLGRRPGSATSRRSRSRSSTLPENGGRGGGWLTRSRGVHVLASRARRAGVDDSRRQQHPVQSGGDARRRPRQQDEAIERYRVRSNQRGSRQ